MAASLKTCSPAALELPYQNLNPCNCLSHLYHWWASSRIFQFVLFWIGLGFLLVFCGHEVLFTTWCSWTSFSLLEQMFQFGGNIAIGRNMLYSRWLYRTKLDRSIGLSQNFHLTVLQVWELGHATLPLRVFSAKAYVCLSVSLCMCVWGERSVLFKRTHVKCLAHEWKWTIVSFYALLSKGAKSHFFLFHLWNSPPSPLNATRFCLWAAMASRSQEQRRGQIAY